MSAPLDWLFPVRPGESNEELKFALRSLSNIPHGRVWMVGYKPSWVQGVEYIPGGNSAPWARANLYQNLLLACTHPGMPDEIIITMDDVFLVGPQTNPVPIMYRGPLDDQVSKVTRRAGPRGWWQESLLTTRDVLLAAGYTDPISYELHVPFRCNRQLMAYTLQRFASVTPHNPPQWRTLYGVVNQIGGRVQADCKALRPGPIGRPYHSTEDLSWRYFRSRFLEMFPQPSPYEIPQADARSLVTVSPRRHMHAPRRARA